VQAKFFFIALFFSYFRSSMISLVFTKVGHCYTRRIRLPGILSGGFDSRISRQLSARRLTCRVRRIRVERVAPAGFEWSARGPIGLLSKPPVSTSQRARSKNGAHTPRGSRHPTRPFSFLFLSLLFLSLLFLSLLFSAAAQPSHAQILFLRF
jgi:hypothetical protein